MRNNLNPDFTTFIECDYFFEREQQIKMMVYDVDGSSKDFIGKNECTIAQIIGSVRQTYLADLTLENNKTSRGKIIVRLDSVNVSNDEIRMKIKATLQPIQSLCCYGVNNPYFIFSRARDQTTGSDFVRTFQSPSL